MDASAGKKGFFKTHVYDGVVLLSLILLTAGGLIAKAASDRSMAPAGLRALILKEGAVVQEIDLNALPETSTFFTVHGVHDDLTVEAKRNAIRVEHSGCPGQECVHEGWVTSSRPIICAYNKIYIDVFANSVDEEVLLG